SRQVSFCLPSFPDVGEGSTPLGQLTMSCHVVFIDGREYAEGSFPSSNMAWTKYQLFLAGLMLTTGSINTLSAKWADMFSAKGCHALNMTSASSFQMLRGAVIIFTGLLSVAFLGRRLAPSQWLGISITILGLVVVGLADFVSGHRDDSHKLSDVITGDLLIIMAQIIVSVQMVLEEKFVYKHDVHPLRAVGTEGLFGFVVLSLLLIPMYFIHVGDFSDNPRQVLEDALDAFCQIGYKPLILLALLGNTVSIAFFNFAGISVTKEISATTRMVLDSLRTLVIWVVSLALGWEQFQGLQVLGFLVLLTGTALYNGLHRPLLARIPWCAARMNLDDESSDAERERLLNDGRVLASEDS
ncbi:hypothetical protein CCH79_00000478, partial [Gambusia affinis]